MNTEQLREYLIKAIPARMPILIASQPGAGKTSVINQVGEFLGQDVIIDYPAMSDPTDYKGLPFGDSEHKIAGFLPLGNLARIISAKHPTIYFMDELGQGSESVQKAIMPIVGARTAGDYRISDHVTIIAATNRRTDRGAGVGGILEPLKQRFFATITLEVQIEPWLRWANANHLPIELIAFCKMRPDLVTSAPVQQDLGLTSNPRTIEHLARQMMLGVNPDVENEVYASTVGQGFADEFCGFLKIMRNLPDFDRIPQDPTGVRIPSPSDLGTSYALIALLPTRITLTSWSAYLAYIQRLNPDYQVCLRTLIENARTDLVPTIEYINWTKSLDNLVA